MIYELTRKLRNFEELQRILNIRTRQLAERSRRWRCSRKKSPNETMNWLEQFGRRNV